MKTVIVGIGKMGTQLALKLTLPRNTVLIDKYIDPRKIKQFEDKGMLYSDDLQDIKGADVIILAVNPKDLDDLAKSIFALILQKCLIINIATNREIQSPNKYIATANIKIIGEATAIENGISPAIVIPNSICTAVRDVIIEIFSTFGIVLQKDISDYIDLNYNAAYYTIKAISNTISLLHSKNLPEEIINIVVRNLMAGTCMSYPWPDDDDFIQRILKQNKI
ncbi:pyrroline-5-carboxylate reductase family protein [Bacteroides cellulosilyticus]|uniref:pyrroline-5-carboxylate reductase family protein n=1 Tax=Bacteroides cellulosilyticus TaxID=246787 RepID=UPI0022E4D6AE|nr:NAD(P)-binding domain-containing protein [Bacteroides cellulosilyticus]